MAITNVSRWFASFVMIFAMTSMMVAQKVEENENKRIQHTTMRATNPASGREMFTNYCAACHGLDGKGSGPAASALKTAPADLTSLAKKNGGKFPEAHVSSVIRGESGLSAHGSREMPIWGKLFLQASGGNRTEVQQRVANLVQYLKSMQAE